MRLLASRKHAALPEVAELILLLELEKQKTGVETN